MKKILVTSLALFVFAGIAQAHVTVRPNQAGVASFQTFTVSVPSEKDSATTQIRLELPMGLQNFTPTVKPGWRIDVRTHEMNGETHPIEIVWSGGSIPGHYRDEFTFSTRVPAQPQTMVWKAHQTYADGSVVSWNLDPKAEQPKNAQGAPDFSQVGPYSETKVVDDVSTGSEMAQDTDTSSSSNATPLIVSSIALVMSLFVLVQNVTKKTQ